MSAMHTAASKVFLFLGGRRRHRMSGRCQGLRARRYVLTMARPHAAALLEDAFHRRSNALLRGRGWRTRTISHTGYGSQDFVRVLGRVLLSRRAEPLAMRESDLSEAEASIRALRGNVDEQRGWRAFVTAGAMGVRSASPSATARRARCRTAAATSTW